MRESIKRVEPVDQHLNQVWVQPVPEQADMETVFGALKSLVSRHESMRARYGSDDSGRPRQRVVGTGAFWVDVRDCESTDLRQWSEAAARELRDHHYDLLEGPLLKVIIAAQGGRPRLLAMGLSHMVADGWGLRIVRSELADAMHGNSTPVGSAWQPSDQIRFEATPAAIRQGERSLRYFADQFQRFPSTMLWRRRERAEHPRYWSGTLHAPALNRAVSRIYVSHGIGPAAAVFAAFSLVIANFTDRDANSMFLIYSNRTPRNIDSVANYSQTVPISVDVRTGSFWNLMKTTHRAMLNAYRHAAYPPERQLAVRREAGDGRGIRIIEDCVYNPRWRATGPELEQEAASAATSAPSSTYSWNPGADRGLALYFGTKPNVLSLTADTRFFDPEQFEPALRRVESMVVKGADTDFDPPTAEHALSRQPPGDDWAFIDHCWVDLRSTREMVAKAVGADSVEVAVVLEGSGRRLLTARLPGDRTEPSLAEARTRCLRALHQWRNVMVPHTFTEE